MPTVAAVMSELKKKGKEQTRKIYARHGMDPDRVYGVSVADLKVIAKHWRVFSMRRATWMRCIWPAWWQTAPS